MRKSLHGYLLIAPIMLGCLVFYAAPFVMVMRYSVSRGSGIAAQFAGFENYRNVFYDETFVVSYGNSFLFLAVSLPLIMILAYLIALLMQKQAGKHQILKSVFLFPYIMPVAGTVLLVDLIFSETGLLNDLLTLLHLPVADWLMRPEAFAIVVLLYLWKNTGYSVILLLAGLVTIPEDQYEAADLDGATGWQKFKFITTPQMWYSVFFALVFAVINAFKCFREIFLIGGQHPNDDIYMLQHFINNSFENMNYGNLSCSSVMLLVIILTFFGVFYAFVNKKEEYRK